MRREYYDSNQSISVESDHINICKIEADGDEYNHVKRAIGAMVDHAMHLRGRHVPKWRGTIENT